MINEFDTRICGFPLHLSKAQVMQCFIMKNYLSLANKACSPMFDNWDKLFPTIDALTSQIGVEMVHIIERFQQELRYLFWDAGEEIPCDEETVFSTLLVDFTEGADLYPATVDIEERAKQIVYQAEMEVEGIRDPSGRGNYVNIGFGLYGAIQAGVANLGASLLDHGIEQMATNSTIKKYQAQIEDLRKGSQTTKTFKKIAHDFIMRGCLYAIQNVAERNNVPCLAELRQPEWDKRRPSYVRLSADDKIRECISELAFCPIHQDVFRELIELSNGKDEALIEFGNLFIGPNAGTDALRQYGEQKYQSALNMSEESIEDIATKIEEIQKSYELRQKDSSADKEIERLRISKEKKELINRAEVRRTSILKRLESMSWNELLNQKDINSPDGWTTFILESFLVENNYENLPESSIIQRFLEKNNATPLLIHTEFTTKKGVEPIDIWTRWARKGNPYALLRLGLCRLHGNGIEKDIVRSKQLLCRAADQGYPPAVYILYQIALGKYKSGFGYIEPDDKIKYNTLLDIFNTPEETYKRYLSFGRKYPQ